MDIVTTEDIWVMYAVLIIADFFSVRTENDKEDHAFRNITITLVIALMLNYFRII